jgi:flagellar hook-associated protein FlgK
MSLLTSLATASTALQAFSTALGVDQTNVSNVSTPGFAALRATIRPINPTHPGLDSSTGSVAIRLQSHNRRSPG